MSVIDCGKNIIITLNEKYYIIVKTNNNKNNTMIIKNINGKIIMEKLTETKK